jgi:dolichyl-phosphate-mannose-protein mannosyltransferase
MDKQPSRPLPASLILAAIVIAGLAIRLALLPANGRPGDTRDFVGWTLTIIRFGTHGLYAHAQSFGRIVDYPPGYPLILTVIAHVYTATQNGGDPHYAFLRSLLKLPAIFADLGLCFGLFVLARRSWSTRGGLMAAAFIAFSPSTWLISAYWGQVDSVSALFFVLALICAVEKRYGFAWLMLAITVLVKPQPLVVAPILLIWQWKNQGTTPRLLLGPLIGLAVAYLGSLPFTPNAQPPAVISWLAQRYLTGTGLYPFTSVSAFNIFTIGGTFFQPDTAHVLGLAISTWGMLAFGIVVAIVAIALIRTLTIDSRDTYREQSLFTAAFIALAALFVLTTRMHERYLFPALTLAPLLWLAGGWSRLVAATMVFTFIVNCVLVLSPVPPGHAAGLLVRTLSLLNVASLILLTATFVSGNDTPLAPRVKPLRSSSMSPAAGSQVPGA